MNLDPYIEEIHAQLDMTAEAGGEEALAVARRIAAPLDAAIRLALQEVLAAAAEEITVELAPGSVELRLRGREPQLVVTAAPPEPSAEDRVEEPLLGVFTSAGGADDQTMARINVRMPEHLKARVEEAAEAEGLSVNAWLVRAAAARVERAEGAGRRDRRAPHGAQHYTGWAR
jgi:HicB family